jgi:hypothetical protein
MKYTPTHINTQYLCKEYSVLFSCKIHPEAALYLFELRNLPHCSIQLHNTALNRIQKFIQPVFPIDVSLTVTTDNSLASGIFVHQVKGQGIDNFAKYFQILLQRLYCNNERVSLDMPLLSNF